MTLSALLDRLDAADLTATHFAVAMALVTLLEGGTATCLLEQIADRAHLSERRVRDSLAVLKALDLITIEKRRIGSRSAPTRYAFLPDEAAARRHPTTPRRPC
jgi:hypothetical protein